MCFNGPKTYQLGWFPQYHLDLTASSSSGTIFWTGNLIGFAEKPVDNRDRDNDKMIIKITGGSSGDYYVHFNRKTGINADTNEGGDKVLISRRGSGDDYASQKSWLEAQLSAGESYSTVGFEGLNIMVNAIDNGIPRRATVTIQLGARVEETPTIAPSAIPTRTETPTKSATITESPMLTQPNLNGGVASTRCPSGYRALLETATLAYTTQNTGWDRLNNLVDEQDTTFTFEAWEPGYPLKVTVAVSLDQSVQAADIRVAQDPFTPVSGTIDITARLGGAAVESFGIELGGVNGWKAHSFVQPVTIDGFTITRSNIEANIMEVMICTTD